MNTETRILNVPLGHADEAMRLRSRFGWTVLGTSARSQLTGLTTVGATGQAGSIGVLGAQSQAQTKETVDITLQRVLDERGLKLRELEKEFDATQFQQPKLKFTALEHVLLWGGLVLVPVYAVGLLVLISLFLYHTRRLAPKMHEATRKNLDARNAILEKADKLRAA